MDNEIFEPEQQHGIVKSDGTLARRGLDLAGELQEVRVTLDEEPILRLMHRFGEVRRLANAIPDGFVNGRTANPHDVAAFDLMEFLTAFDLLQMRRGYVLDYVYAFDGHGGEPLVYARRADEDPISTVAEYFDKFALPRPEMLLGDEPTEEDSRPYLPFLHYDKTPVACFQFALFCMTVRRFYLYWHSNYNDRKYILTRAGLDRILHDKTGDISEAEAELLQKTWIGPEVLMRGPALQVALFSYERNSGYSLLRLFVRYPNTFERLEAKQIVKNHSEWLF
jgi:hypothetical protein